MKGSLAGGCRCHLSRLVDKQSESRSGKVNKVGSASGEVASVGVVS